jgi:hypothetical protein
LLKGGGIDRPKWRPKRDQLCAEIAEDGRWSIEILTLPGPIVLEGYSGRSSTHRPTCGLASGELNGGGPCEVGKAGCLKKTQKNL